MTTTLSRARPTVPRRPRTTSRVRSHPTEELARPRDLARPFVEVRERVPEPEVELLDALHVVGPPGQRLDRELQAPGVRVGAGEHDAALGDERAGRRRLRELGPELLDLVEAPLRPPAVHQHRVLLDRAATGRRMRSAPWWPPGSCRAGIARARAAPAPPRRPDRRRAAVAAGGPRRVLGPPRTPRPPGRAGPGHPSRSRPATRRELVGRLGGAPAPARNRARRRLAGLGRLRGCALALLLGRRRACALDRPQHRSLQASDPVVAPRRGARCAGAGTGSRCGSDCRPRGSCGRIASARDASVARGRGVPPVPVASRTAIAPLAADAPSAACRRPDRGAARRRALAADAPSAACRHPDPARLAVARLRRTPLPAACRHPDRGGAGRPVPAARRRAAAASPSRGRPGTTRGRPPGPGFGRAATVVVFVVVAPVARALGHGGSSRWGRRRLVPRGRP